MKTEIRDAIVTEDIPDDLDDQLRDARDRIDLAAAALIACWPAEERDSAEEGVLSHLEDTLDLFLQLGDSVRPAVSYDRLARAVSRLDRDGAHLLKLAKSGLVNGSVDGAQEVCRVGALKKAGDLLQGVAEDLRRVLQELQRRTPQSAEIEETDAELAQNGTDREALKEVVRGLAVAEATILRTAEARRDRAERSAMELQGLRKEIEDRVGIDRAGSEQIVAEANDRAAERMES